MRTFDFSSWADVLSTVLGLAVITPLGVGTRIEACKTRGGGRAAGTGLGLGVGGVLANEDEARQP